MEREAFADAEVIAATGAYVCHKVDVDASPGLAARYAVDRVPTLCALAPDGSLVRRLVGARDAQSLRRWLLEAAQRARDSRSRPVFVAE